ncbi:hypothetical protein [Kordiimonas aestuarii]|uniref:hypothetical protein n=1 Tax=Kordiimonas aestuarii TaxID=1005925 RepID=UPI0021D0EC1F|nr:hypothetical protein [Kordiimonas aestuarii]
MNKLLVGGILVGAIAAGGYFYAAHSLETSVERMVVAYNENEANGFTISYTDLDTSLLSRTATITGIHAQNRATPENTVSVGTARLDVGFGFSAGTPRLKSVRLNNTKATNTTATVRVGYLHVAGESLEDLSMATSFPAWSGSLHKVEILDAEVLSITPESAFSLGAFQLDISDGGNWLDEFLIKDVNITSTLPDGAPAQGKLDTFQIRGGNVGALLRFVETTQAQALFGVADPALSQQMAHEMAKESLNYFGFEGFELSGLAAELPNGITINLDNASVTNISRHAGIVTGANSKIEEFVVSNLGKASPQAAQLLAIAGLDTFRLNGTSRIRYDDTSKSLQGRSKMVVSDMFGIDSKMELSGVDVEKMAEKLLAVQQAQFDFMSQMQANPDEQLTPEEINDQMVERMIDAYTGYYSGFDLDLALADMGGTARVLDVYSAMTGVPPETLQAAFIAGVKNTAKEELGDTTPESLMPAVNGFLATPSQPLYLKVKTKKTPDEEILRGLTAENWPELLEVSFRVE